MDEELLIEQAKQLATKAHAGQTRWNGSPYINHPVAVANILETNLDKWRLKRMILIPGYLHDVIEDTNITYDDLVNQFGVILADIVLRLTHLKNESYAEYIKRISTDRHASAVKICDLQHNLSDLIYPKDRQRKDKYMLAKMYLEDTWLLNR
jgi:(p)ppGpp synthase/HD superfamily hydrolase